MSEGGGSDGGGGGGGATSGRGRARMVCAAADCTKHGRKPCAGCRCPRYCSRACQKRHWKATAGGHKAACGAMARFHEAEHVQIVGEAARERCRQELMQLRDGGGKYQGIPTGEVQPWQSWPREGGRVSVRVWHHPPCDMTFAPESLLIVGGDVDKDASCWVCLEGAEAGRLRQGCSCRGSAGAVHLQCLVQAAAAQQDRIGPPPRGGPDGEFGTHMQLAMSGWLVCNTCKQEYVGSLGLDFVRACNEHHQQPATSEIFRVTMNVSTGLASLLASVGRYDEAEMSVKKGLALAKKIYGPEDSAIMDYENTLASLEQRRGNTQGKLRQAPRAPPPH